MGRRGRGHFAGDAAMDFADELVRGVVARVEAAVADPARLGPDEYYGAALPGMAEVLTVLCRLTGTRAAPTPDAVAGWQAAYLGALDRTGPDPDRRAAVRATFDALRRAARAVHGGDEG